MWYYYPMTNLIDNWSLAFKNNPDWTYAHFQCNQGWNAILGSLFDSIESYLQSLPNDSKVREEFVFEQIKEKFGGLRVYVSGADDHLYTLITETEDKADSICELCGEDGSIAKKGHYWRTVCTGCRTKHEYACIEPRL